ncbi:MAG: tRNA guanosine(34) transglycosylase Tgt [Nanoarchaeota archaeon]|nr:tRNA guanosine(34) transglycosylase Tgt [Nanoarchaeota archaeon]
MFEVKYSDGEARIGSFETRHGRIETPFFMPVATKLSVKLIEPKELKPLNVEAIISNALLLYLRPGLELIKKFKGVHGLMGFDKVIFTDSGGFQMISDKFLVDINEKKCRFRDPYTKKIIDMYPEKNMDIQERLRSDVAMCLDYMPRHGDSLEKIKKSVKITYEWGKRCKESHADSKQKLFGIIQGGLSKELREKSCELMKSLDFDGYAIGGLAIGENKEELKKVIDNVVKKLPKEKPRYLMGVGSIPEIFENIEKGIDCFDSCYVTRHARHAVAFTKKGEIRLEKGIYKEDFNPIEKDCKCDICKNYSRAYINYLIKINEYNWMRLVSLHNIYFIQNLIKEIKEAIKEKRFKEFKKEYLSRSSGLDS